MLRFWALVAATIASLEISGEESRHRYHVSLCSRQEVEKRYPARLSWPLHPCPTSPFTRCRPLIAHRFRAPIVFATQSPCSTLVNYSSRCLCACSNTTTILRLLLNAPQMQCRHPPIYQFTFFPASCHLASMPLLCMYIHSIITYSFSYHVSADIMAPAALPNVVCCSSCTHCRRYPAFHPQSPNPADCASVVFHRLRLGFRQSQAALAWLVCLPLIPSEEKFESAAMLQRKLTHNLKTLSRA